MMKSTTLNNLKSLTIKLLLSFGPFLAVVIGFVAIADEVREGSTLAFDETVLRAINGFSSPVLDAVFIFVTNMGGFVFASLATASLAGFFAYKSKRYAALFLTAVVGGAALISFTLKLMFERARPDLWQQLVIEQSFSFPSGHATASAALALGLSVILWDTKWRAPALWLAGIYIIAVGFSRLYLGVHYPTDILAGWLMSLAWIMVVTKLFQLQLYRKRGGDRASGRKGLL
jgi:membrane-associated phospholipid phosphatase